MALLERRSSPERRPGRAVRALGGVLLLYLALVAAGGGWSPRFDDSFRWPDNALLLFAHRGAAMGVPENSEASLAQARRLGFRAVEIDVRKTKDGTLALFHDETAQRMLGLDAEFEELTLAQLRARPLRVEGRTSSSTVPTLQDVFERFGRSLVFYLDMKNKGFEDAEQVARLIEAFGMRERTVVASVDPLFIAYLEQRHPGINTALERFDFSQVWLYQLIPSRWKPDYLSGQARKVSPDHVGWLEKEGLLPKRIVYGADKPQFERMMRLGIGKLIVRYDPTLHTPGLSPEAPNR